MPRGIVQSVVVSGLAGWVMLCAVVLAIPDLDHAAAPGARRVHLDRGRGAAAAAGLLSSSPASLVAQYLCGLATVTSASRMAYAFARDGGLPASAALRAGSSERYRTPTVAIWTVALAAALLTVYTPVYATIAAVAAIFLYISYVLPTALGLVAYGRRWTMMGPWNLGRWYRPLAAISVLGLPGPDRHRHAAAEREERLDRGRRPPAAGRRLVAGMKDRFQGPPEALRARYVAVRLEPAVEPGVGGLRMAGENWWGPGS